MAQFINTIKDVSKNYSRYDKWEQEQADKTAKKQWIVQNLNIPADKIELTKNRAASVIRATEIMDNRSESNCENVEQVMNMVSMIPAFAIPFLQLPATNLLKKYFNKHSNEIKDCKEKLKNTIDPIEKGLVNDKIGKLMQKNAKKAANIGLWGTIGLSLASGIGMILWGNAKQKEASRIGRFQAKQNELKDLENFIIYTPEQLAQAEEIAKSIPDKKERNSLIQAIHELADMGKNVSAYKRWAKQKDPNELEKLKAVNLSPEELLKANDDKELITNTVAQINIKAEEFSENLENAFDTVGMLSFLLAAPLGFGINKVLSIAKVSPKIKTWVSTLVPIFTTLGIQIKGSVEQKEAARIGRYQARKDLMNNPSQLMSFTEEEMSKASEVKAPKQKLGLFDKIGKSFKFLGQYMKQKKEYKNYKENIQKRNEKLQQAFKQIETTDSQKNEAKQLQTNVFRAFDEVDEMSQRYSEDIEATTEIAKSTANTLFNLAWVTGVGILGAGIYKGKISLAKPIKKLSDICFKKESTLRKSVTNLYDALNAKGKNGPKEFQKAIISGNLKDYLKKTENNDIKLVLNELTTEFNDITSNGIMNARNKNFNSALTTIFEKHFKQTTFAKLCRNITIQSLKFKANSLIDKSFDARISALTIATKKSPSKETLEELFNEKKNLKTELGLDLKYKNYKTLVNTGIVAGIPLLAPLFAVPYMFNSWLTDIQKKAGKIGVMKAMENLDDPRIFATQSQNN